MSTTTPFGTIKAAKDYLAGKITAEAERQGTPLSKLEREMLYFTEEGGLSKHMEKVCEEFDRVCDENEYEAKIGSLVQSLQLQMTPEEQDLWDDAVLKLCDGDHYLLALIDAGAPPSQKSPFSFSQRLRAWLPENQPAGPRPPGDRHRLVLVSLLILLLILMFMSLFGGR